MCCFVRGGQKPVKICRGHVDGFARSELEEVDDLRGPHAHLATAAFVDGAARIISIGHDVVQIGQIVPRPVGFTLLLRSHCRDLITGTVSTHGTKSTMPRIAAGISAVVGQPRRGRPRTSRGRHEEAGVRSGGRAIRTSQQ